MNGPIKYVKPPQGAVCSVCQIERTWWEHLIEFPDLDSARVRPARTQATYPTGYTMLSLEPPKAYLCADCSFFEEIATCQVCQSDKVVWRVWRNGRFDWFCENHTHNQVYENLETGECLSPRGMS